MIGPKALRNGALVDASSLVFPLDDADITHGYGCYETLALRAGTLRLPGRHLERLIRSADILGMRHGLARPAMEAALAALVAANRIADCNLKLVLVGHADRDADWYAFMLPPLHPPEGAHEAGLGCLAFRGERQFPRAKSLSLLMSTVAFRAAASLGCWDALLVNGRGELTEGTRTNIFYIRLDEPLVTCTPPAADALEGVTRGEVLAALAEAGQALAERPLRLAELAGGRVALMLTSTSTGLAPVSRIMDGTWLDLPVPPRVAELRGIYERHLSRYASGR